MLGKQWSALCCLMGHTSGSMEDSGAEVISTVGVWLKRFQRRGILICGLKTVLVIVWWRMRLVLPLSKNLPEAKVKSFELIALAEEISKQPSIDTVVWSLVSILIKIYNDKDQAEQGNIQNTQIEEERTPGVEWS